MAPLDPAETEQRFSGIGVSPGISDGPLVLKTNRFDRPPVYPIVPERVDEEIARLHQAARQTRDEIQTIQTQIAKEIHADDASIFDAHLLVLEDKPFFEEVERTCRAHPRNIESVFFDVIQRYMESLKHTEDPYLRERVIDMEDVGQRIISHLLGSKDPQEVIDQPHIVFSRDLTPGDTAHMDRTRVLGFATHLGSYTSHTAIMARSLNIPGVVGLDVPPALLISDTPALLDGYNGLLILNPSDKTKSEYEKLRASKRRISLKFKSLRDRKALTADGKHIMLSANIEFGHEIEFIKKNGAEGVGLYRTEFFFLRDSVLPDEETQTKNYASIAKALNPEGVIIRTLDIGGDKLHTLLHEPEPNPFLGCRGIRLSLEKPELFKTQLRAILRASAFGKVSIMYPMISGLEEIRSARKLLETCQEELTSEGIAFDRNLEVGCIIELPCAAVMADLLAPELDFFSVGTNDLTQYTLAVDRVNERVAHLYQSGHPAILRLLKHSIAAAREQDIWVGVCGEMAGDPLFTPIMVGMGFDELSVGPSQLLQIKYAMSRLDSKECMMLVEELLTLGTAEEINARCRQAASKAYGDYL